jgi:predicted PurR-regulated permease PerM
MIAPPSANAFGADWLRKGFLIFLALGISALFLAMIREFLSALLVAALLGGLVHPLYVRLLRVFRGRAAAASGATTATVFLALIVPAIGLLGLVAGQAVQVSQAVVPWLRRQLTQPNALDLLVDRFPILEAVRPYRETILAKLGSLASWMGTFVVTTIAETARETAVLIFLLFVTLYAMFFFLMEGRAVLDKILYCMPLPAEDEERMVQRFLSVTRATIKGTVVIGVLQGILAGGAFWVAGIEGAAFWGTIMAVLSIIPGVGAGLVWVPGVIYLLAIGHTGAGIGLAIWCAALVGSIDNFLRPWLVGRDTEMSDLLILLATLGGITAFGALGIIIGPILAALFVTVWDIYGTTFRGVLPAAPAPAGAGESPAPADETLPPPPRE